MIRRCTSPPLSHYQVQISIICLLFFFFFEWTEHVLPSKKYKRVYVWWQNKWQISVTCHKQVIVVAPSRCPKTYITYMFWLHPISFPDTRGTFKMLFYKMLNCYDGLFVADDVMR